MKLSRREVLKLGLGTGASMMLGMKPRLAWAAQDELITKPIPSSGEQVPVMGIGTARRYDVEAGATEMAELKEVVDLFPKLGGRLIDTAPSYGRAEIVVGELVHEIGNRDQLFLATKVQARDPAEGPAQIEESFRRLHTDVIDLFQVHNLADVQNHLGYLRNLKNEGRIRYVGITTSSDRQYEAFEEVMRTEEGIDFIQVDYSIDNRGVEDRILPLAQDRGMAVLCNLPFGRSRLFERAGDRVIPDFAAPCCESWAQYFLKFIVSHPAVTAAIPGTATVRYLRDNIGSAKGRLPSAELRQEMLAFYEALPAIG
jgi:aryl-alcohol dehydrogenase-like predicted oxidoreductase